MSFLKGQDSAGLFDNFISDKKQVSENAVDLTVKAVYRLTGGGCLDFGGSEYNASEIEEVVPLLKNPEDKYKWWILDPGIYLMEYNESLNIKEGCKALIQMHSRLMPSGVFHPTIICEDFKEFKMPLMAAVMTRIKQNARVSEVRIWEP
jgi:deoxycytidine triphosphate deaminase